MIFLDKLTKGDLIIYEDENDKIEIEIKLWGEFTWKKYVINTLPSQFPEYEFEGISQQKGEYYVTTYQLEAKKYQHYIYKLNHIGEVTFYQATPKVCYQLRKNQIEGKERYNYLESDGELREGFSLSLPTTLVVLDEKYNKIKEIHYYTKEKDERSGEVDRKLDNHDYLYLADNHYILSGFEIKTVYDFPGYEGKAFEVWNSKIQEVKDGKVLWEFQSIEHKQLYQYCDEQNKDMMTYEPYLDYMHFNAIKVDPTDGNLVCSFRNIDAIIKLDRQTGNIIWVLGGIGDEFGLTEQQKFSKQHSISFLSDHSLLIYDNGCKDKKTRILIIKIDEQKKAIEKFTHYNLGIYAVRMGAVQAIQEEDHTYLVTYGVGDNPYGFQELNLETLEPITSFKLKENNALYCVNKSD